MGNHPGSLDHSKSTSRRIDDFYTIEPIPIGRGHYAAVYRATCRVSGQLVAVKKIKKFLTEGHRLKSEIEILRCIQPHRNIIQLFDVFETSREVQLVMELCTGGELFERLADKGPYSEIDCANYFRDMTLAVEALHKQGIIHRDLKPENILLSMVDNESKDGNKCKDVQERDQIILKVADFGLAKFCGHTENGVLQTKCGTWGYSAPEMISGSGSQFGYDLKVDSWSLGTILYILLCGYHPFDPEGISTGTSMIANIKACKFDFEDEAWANISEYAKDLIQHLLVLDPNERYSTEEILKHPWLTLETNFNEQSSSNLRLNEQMLTEIATDAHNDISKYMDDQYDSHRSPLAGIPKVPLSPTIHQDLAKFRQQQKTKVQTSPYQL